MIDTVVLIIPEESFSIIDHNKFDPSTKNLFHPSYYRLGSRSNFSCVQNPTKTELRSGNYKPRLTVTKRMKNREFQITLKIEFSIPKLLYGNNFDEIEETDFQEIIKILTEKLTGMGVLISSENLIKANISTVHFSKNIPLPDYKTCYSVLNELSKVNLNKKLDINKTDYRNEGHCLKFHSNSFEVVFYDKLKDLDKAKTSEKRAIEKDNFIQFDLFQEKKLNRSCEVLRIEVRLNTRTKLKQILKRIEVKNDLIFSSIFQKSLSQKVLLYFLNQIEIDYSLLVYKAKTSKDFLIDFKIANPSIKLRKLIQMLGLKNAIEEMGIREFREVIKLFGNHGWYRIKRDYDLLNVPLSNNNWIKFLKNALIDFQSLKLTDFLDGEF